MGNINTTFLGKEYSIPADVVTYVGLVDFTNEIRDALMTSFKQQIWPKIDVIESNNFMISSINDQVTKFIRKLLENDIYDRTANDYLQGNKGYELFLDTKRKVLKQIISIRQEKLDTYRAGVEGAIYRKEASVTGLDFGIISSSFVNHMIYAYMDASKQTEQEQEALKTYNREIAELDKRVAEYDRQENAYIADNVIPAMNTVFTFFAYELLDKYVSDLIKAGKFDKAALDFINLERSNDLLENINLAGNKCAVIESAFVACPFNIAVYMHAMKLEILDKDTFETANIFKQGKKIVSFLNESMGTADYPNFVEPNYYSAALLARYTNESEYDVLHQHTSSYANAVIREYGKIIKALNSSNQCREYLRKLNDEEILSGEGTSKHLANRLVYSITTNSNWNILTRQCGHADLLERLLAIMPAGSTFGSKADCDSYLVEALFNALEATRKDLAQRILESRARAEAERQKIEAQKRKKRIKTTAILCAIVAVIIVAISLPSIIENAKISKRESYVEEQIQAVIVPLEREMEDATGIDVIIDYSFSLENDWQTELWYDWDFYVRIPIFEDYRKSNTKDEQDLLIIMDACKILEEIYQDARHDLGLIDLRYNDARVVLDYSGGALDIRDLSTYETFYYEEHSGNRYLHSLNTEYVLDINVQSNQAKEDAYNEALALMSAQKYDEAIVIFYELNGYKDSAAKITECENANIELKYNHAVQLMANGKYEEALAIFADLNDYKDSQNKINECNNAIFDGKYTNAIALMDERNYIEAYKAFAAIKGYKDSDEKITLIKSAMLNNAKVGDCIFFGAYEQDNNLTNGKEDIEWLVLDIKGNKLLVISKNALDCKAYNTEYSEGMTWETCTLRKWLNDNFISTAFSSSEVGLIPTVAVSADKNPEYDTNPGNATQDRVFLLSIAEANRYFSSDSERKCTPTNYAIANGAYVYSSNGCCYWWLRTPGCFDFSAAEGYRDGSINEFGSDADADNCAVRPAMWIEIA